MPAETQRESEAAENSSLVAEGNFIRATRDTGYRNTAAAVAELIDNALQAGARQIHLFIFEARIDGERGITLAVLDDGVGMDPLSLRRSVQFGGSSRFDDRSGLGRYGMGLPNSSLSQARRLEVLSWETADSCYRCYLDVDEVLEGRHHGISEAQLARMPEWAEAHAEDHGTLVIWSRCDRLLNRKATTLIGKLKPAIGRIYRRMIWAGVQIRINGESIKAVDPLFAHPRTGSGGGVPYGPPLRYRIRVPGREEDTIVEVRFVELPVAEWHTIPASKKREMGIVGGGGVSILRAGREIDFGWHLMGAKRRENYDDWWRCEVAFSPDADELFGVTHSKQGVAPSPELRAILGPDLESVARELNARARASFELCRELSGSDAVATATLRDAFLPALHTPKSRLRGRHFEYRIHAAPLETGELFATARRGTVITVRLNSEHPFVARIYQSAVGLADGRSRLAIESLMLAAARARLVCVKTEERDAVDHFIGEWSNVLAAFMER
jgi:DNA mismatch repair enzyme (predicted ATPase)